MYPNVHNSTIHNNQVMLHSQLPRFGNKCPLTEEWVKKMWYVYTLEYYSAIKKNEIMSFATTQMDVETIIVSEVSQKRKANTV